MRAELINPFITAAREVLVSEINSEVTLGKLTVDKGKFQTKEIKVMISVTGELEGIVFYGLSKETACNITATMLGESVAEFNSMAQSAVAEMGNIISGRAGAHLEVAGYITNISTPVVLIGENANINTFELKPLLVPLVTDCGEITLWVSLRDGK